MAPNTITLNSTIHGNLAVCGQYNIYRREEDTVDIRLNDDRSIIIGEINQKHKIYIVEPWQTSNPIFVKSGLCVSLEKDLISYDEIKADIINVLNEERPDISLKLGLNSNNISLVKHEVSLEIKTRNNK